ncbi:MAG TPA: BMP family ABC transporter substrate-binding protein [Syntrophobacteraceae bacterium]|nr:BMP family ABC transporter substrate-binding protein [Syntrophobacteraceae bacterium]
MRRDLDRNLYSLPASLAFTLLLSLLAMSSVTTSQAYGKALQVVVITDAAGLGDKGFNDVCWQGVLKAKSEFGFEAKFLQSREQADYVANLTLAAQHADIVVTLGYLFVDAVKKVAPYFPNTHFIHVEGDIPAGNVASFDFKSEEGGFLAGLVAGLFTKSHKVGVVSGMEIPPVEAYVSGFRAGIKTAEKIRGESLEAIVASAGSFNDPVKGKSLAQTLINQYVDVIFRCAGNTGLGVVDAVREADGVYLIAEDLDMDAEMPGKVLASTLKRMDVAVYGALRSIVKGEFKGGHHWLGAGDNAIDITEMKYSQDQFTPKNRQQIQKARTLLKQGSLIIPEHQNQVDSFQPPEL